MQEFPRRLPLCLVGIEACASAQDRARALAGFGDDVRLMQRGSVKGYAKRSKTDREEDRGRAAAAQADGRCAGDLPSPCRVRPCGLFP
jgi:transposase